ncbi:adenylosuccinate synthase [Methylobacterium sp. WL6]|nr:adenylosuccinate synthase [Methylobacterium sp. WL6]
MRVMLALSGPVGVGKTCFTRFLEERFAAQTHSTQEMLRRRGAAEDRKTLQDAGEDIDQATGGAWVSDDLAKVLSDDPNQLVIVDAVRIKKQIDHLRRTFGARWRVWHVFIDADDTVLRQRYADRPSPLREFENYDQVKESATERGIQSLKSVADRVVDASCCELDSVVAQAVAGLGFYPLEVERLVDVVVGGEYGSEGKGHVCSYLAPGYDLLVRVGGPNAGHKAVLPERITYIQLPSGTAANPNSKIVIGAGATLYVPQILNEIAERGLTPERLSIDPQAMIIEEGDREYESGRGDRIGSTKQGVGAATARKILGRFDDKPLGIAVRLAEGANELKDFVRPTAPLLEDAFARGRKVFLEGTQGTELSLHHGSWPHVTSRDTTVAGCLADAGIAPGRVRKVIMVTRTYPIRVGGPSGPISRETSYERISERSGIPEAEIRGTETGTISHNPRRIAEFDWEQVRHAAVLNGATDIALSFSDYLSIENRKARRFEDLTEETRAFIEGVERVTNAPVSLVSTRFEPRGIIDRRNWR